MDFLDFDNGFFDIDMNSDMSDYGDMEFDHNDYILNHQDDSYYNNISFHGNENSDGYIPDGKISLERTISGNTDTFEHYTKNGHDYVKVGNKYIQIDKGNTVTINNIKYDTI